MADKTIGSLPRASSVIDGSLLVMEQSGQAQAVTGALIKAYAVQAAKVQADNAARSASSAAADKTAAQSAKQAAETAKNGAEASSKAAEASRQAIENLTVTATNTRPGSQTYVEKRVSPDGKVTLNFFIEPGPVGMRGPSGPQGPQGERGLQGPSPTRGVDYWTEEDQKKIVDEAVAALPKWNWGVY